MYIFVLPFATVIRTAVRKLYYGLQTS